MNSVWGKLCLMQSCSLKRNSPIAPKHEIGFLEFTIDPKNITLNLTNQKSNKIFEELVIPLQNGSNITN